MASVSISTEQDGHFFVEASIFAGLDVLFFVFGVIAKAKATDRAITFNTINKSISIPFWIRSCSKVTATRCR
jgi:hypothetical protein